MDVQVPLRILIFGAVFVGAVAWWTYYLSRKATQVNREMADLLREVSKESVDTCVKAANVTAETAKGILEHTRPLASIIEQMGGVLISRDPSNMLERIIHRQMDHSLSDANGRLTATEDDAETPSARPYGVKLPSEM